LHTIADFPPDYFWSSLIVYDPLYFSMSVTSDLASEISQSSSTMANSNYTVGDYLAERLAQIGLKHYFSVPGDYNLILLDKLQANDNLTEGKCLVISSLCLGIWSWLTLCFFLSGLRQ
jgi:hypothetical protein